MCIGVTSITGKISGKTWFRDNFETVSVVMKMNVESNKE